MLRKLNVGCLRTTELWVVLIMYSVPLCGITSEEGPTMLYTATCGADSHPPPRYFARRHIGLPSDEGPTMLYMPPVCFVC